jgi:hypothetical protein
LGGRGVEIFSRPTIFRENPGYLTDSGLSFILNNLVEKQARIFWHINGCMQDNNFKRIDDDWFNAKRFIGFMIAEHLIECCQDRKCAKILLHPEYKEYLNCLSIEEFLRHRAYFIWHDRNINNEWNGKNADRRQDDYFEAEKNIKGVFRNCNGESCNSEKNITFWHISMGNFQRDEDTAKIISGKKNRLYRLFNEHSACSTKIKKYVESYYWNVEEFITTGKTAEPDIFNKIIESVNEEYSVSNMLEYISKCALLCNLTQETHEIYKPEENKKENTDFTTQRLSARSTPHSEIVRPSSFPTNYVT